MKQGSADDPFADDAADDTTNTSTRDTNIDSDEASPDDSDGSGGSVSSEQSVSEGDSTPQTSRQSLPYIHARDGVKDGRTQRPVFLRDHVEDGIDELLAHMEAELGEDVYKTDVTEAAMAVAQDHPELVLIKLKEWGYGLR